MTTGSIFLYTARSYSDSEEKIGYSLSDVRGRITIATKTPYHDGGGLLVRIWKPVCG